MSGSALSPDSIPGLMELDDEALLVELGVAWTILRDPDMALEAVAAAAAQLEFSFDEQLANRRRRYEPKFGAREPYRPLTGQHELLRFLVFEEMDEFEIAQECAGLHLTANDQIRRYIKQVLKFVLAGNSFDAAVAMTEILCDYSAQQTIEMYELVAPPSRAENKTWQACSKFRRRLLHRIVKRFEDRIEWCPESSSDPKWCQLAAAEASLFTRSLSQLLPPLCPPPAPDPDNAFLTRVLASVPVR